MNRLAPVVRFWDLVSRFKLVFFQNFMCVNTFYFWWPHNEWDIKVVYISAAHHDAESVWWWRGGVRYRVTHCLWFLVSTSGDSGHPGVKSRLSVFLPICYNSLVFNPFTGMISVESDQQKCETWNPHAFFVPFFHINMWKDFHQDA